MQALYAEVIKGVVQVVCEAQGKDAGTGTGFFVSVDGLVATNWHVVRHPLFTGVRVEIGDTKARASVVAASEEADVAILRPEQPLNPGYVFLGRGAGEIKVGQDAVSIGYPSQLKLSMSKGIVSGVRSAEEVRKALSWQNGLKHSYRYVQTDAGIYYGNSGGPLLDDEGAVLGVCTLRLPDSRLGFAIEWQAVADLMAKAVGAPPLDQEAVRARSAARPGELIPSGTPTTPYHVAAAIQQLKRKFYCYECDGTGTVMVAKQVPTETVTRTRIGPRGPYTETVTLMTTVKVGVPCTVCQQKRLYPRFDELYQALCKLTEALHRLDLSTPRAAVAWRDGCFLLEESAVDSHRYASELTRCSAQALAMPQDHIGSPVVFLGPIWGLRRFGDDTFLLVNVFGTAQFVLVASRGRVAALPGQVCQVAGIVSGSGPTTPLVLAISVNDLHPIDPRYTANHTPPPVRGGPGSGPPEPAATPGPATRPGDEAADAKLRLARMYLDGSMTDRAVRILREIIAEFPDSKQAGQAEDLLKSAKAAPK